MSTPLDSRTSRPMDAAASSEASTRPTATAPFGRYLRTPAIVAAEVVAAVGLAGTAYIHLEELSGKFAEVPYLGVGYAILAVACVVSVVMIAARNKLGWYLGGATALATIVGFVLTRTTGLPASTDDIGNWGESIGIWSLIAEGTVVVAAAAVIALHFRTPDIAATTA